MRRIVTILAGAALALALVGPAVAGANDKSTQGSTITAEHVRGGHGSGHGFVRHDHGFFRGGHCFGCFGRGSFCNRFGCAYPFFYGYPYGYYYGGYGCNYDYPCGPPFGYSYDCTRYRGPDGQAAQDPQCKWSDQCQCYYHSSQPPGSAKQGPPPDKNAQPAPNRGQQPPPDQNMQPGPSQGQQPPPDQGQQPPADQGGSQPQPY